MKPDYFNEVWEKLAVSNEALAGFIDNFAQHCGAPRAVFVGQLKAAIKAVVDGLEHASNEDAPPPAYSALELLVASSPQFIEDFLLALRFSYYVKASPLMPDGLYDEAERDYIDQMTAEDSPLMQPGSDREEHYTPRVKALWLYLALYREDRKPKIAPASLASAKSRPVEPPAKGKPAKSTPEGATGTLF